MKDATKIIFVLDRSSSMESIREETISGYNTFIEENKAQPGECTFTLVLFNHFVETIVNNVPISEVQPLNSQTYHPTGYTALRRAAIEAIENAGAQLAALSEEERPNKVLVAIMTDGHENASGMEYSQERLASLIKQQQEQYNWTFVFIGANQDSYATANAMSIPVGNTVNYAATGQSVGATMNAFTLTTSSYRSSKSGDTRKDLFEGQVDKTGHVKKK